MDLQSYLNRIGVNVPLGRDLQSLNRLHQSHATTIPFENLDIQLGRPISIDPETLHKKMVVNRRGGYCFEQNTLMHAALSEVGFDVIACEARVRMGRPVILPRTHMMLIVRIDGERFLVDVGFGGDGLLLPVPMDAREHTQFLWKYRVIPEGKAHVLQVSRPEGWLDLYAFLPEACHPVDFEVANWYTSTHPESRFVQTLTAQLATPEARYILRNRQFSIDRGETQETREINSRDELLRVLQSFFGLYFPPETRFKNPEF